MSFRNINSPLPFLYLIIAYKKSSFNIIFKGESGIDIVSIMLKKFFIYDKIILMILLNRFQHSATN